MLNKTGVATALVITLVFLYAFAAGSLVCADEWSQTTFTEGTFNNTAPANNASDVVLSSSPLSSNWNALASTSATVNYGGALVYPGSGDYIYALCGDLTDNFWAYSISGNSWSAKTDTPVEVGWGGALVSTGGDYIYALRGNSTTDFWRYSISGNSWTDMSDTSDNVASGGALVYPGSGDYIYALRGGNTTDFWRYSISQNSWGAVESTPYNVNAGGSLVYAAGYIYALRGANFKTFWRYDIAQDSWSAKEDAPLAVNGGGAMAYPGSGDYIYAFKGYNSSWPVNNFWAYSISGNSWTTLTRTPSNLNSGGAMAFANGVLYALRGYSTDFWSDQCVNYASSGTFTSTAIEPANVYFWGILQFSATINSILTVDVLKSSDNSLLVHDVPSGTNLFQAYPSTFSGITGIKLRANLLTEDSSHTPILHDWRVGYSSYGTLPQARGAGSDGLAPRITDANATVDLSSGNVNIAVQITNIIPFNGLPTNVVIYYNSIAPADNPVTPLGANWTHTFNMRLITQTGGSIIQVTESGREILFWKDGESPAHWVSYPHYGLYRTIAIDSSTGNFVLTNKDRTTLTFLAANGKFYKAQDLNGHTVTAAYDASGDLDYVTLANGEQIDFTHSSHYMTNCSDPESNSTSFTVTYDRLDSATKSSPSWSYGWTYTGSAALMNVQTFPGSLDSRTYSFTSGKVTSITGPLSEAIGIAYYASPDYAVVTGRDDKVDTVYFNTQLDAWTRWIDEETSRGFDSYRNVITETKPSGATTYWSYDSRGNVLSTTNAALANTKYTYSDSTNPDLPTTILNALGITTTRTYNTAGQLTQEIEDAGASGLNRTSAWYYYSSTNTSYAAVIGQLYQYHRDPADLNLVTTYEYNSKGYGTKETVSKTSTGFSLVTGERVTNDIGWITTSYNVDYPSYIANNVATVYTYDNRGNRLTETDPYSVVTTNQYDLLDRVLTRTVDSAVGGLNLVTAWTYNWGGVTSQTTDPSGLAISSSTVYDAAGKVISRTDPAGATTEYYYYTNARLWKTKRQLTSAPSYAETIYYYDSNGNQTGILDSGGHAISMTYDSIDRLITTTDVASGNTTGSVYDLLDRQTATIDARGYATVTAYDNLNQVKYVRTAQSNITVAYAYDAVGRRNQVIGPWYDTDGDGVADAGEYVNPGNTISAPTAYTEYDPADRVTRTYINNTSTTDAKYYYDAMGDRSIHYVETLVDSATSSYQMVSSQYNKNKQVYLTALDPMGTLNEQTYFYFDNAGRQTATTAAYGSAVSTTSYSILDKASRVITSYTGSATYATGYTYNARGQVLTTTDAEGRVTTNTYDTSGRLTTTTDALGNVVSYGYNVEDLMTSLTYTKGGTSVPTIYTYNSQHRLVRTDQPGYDITNPTGVITNTTYTGYDANGNVTSRTDGAGINIQSTYDKNNRLITKTYPDLSTVSTSYDAVSNLINISDTNTSTANEFDALNRLTKVTDYMYNPAKVIDYTYWNDGTRKTLSALGSTENYTYDKAKRLKTIAIAGMPGNISGYDYNALGQRTAITLGNSSYVTYTYDATTRWLTGVYNSTSTPTSISTFTYTHDKVGNRVTMAEYNGGSSIAVTYTYGAIYRVLTETMQSGMMWQQKGYTYDAPGNRTMMTVDNGMITSYTYYTYNNANQCVSWTDSSGVGFVDKYDGAGNLITETNTATGVMQEWRYDYENHQTVYSTTGTSATYKIDAMGRRISKTNNQQQTTENYLYDGANVLLDLDSAGNFQKIYLMSGLDEPVCFINSQMSMYYYMQDGLGSVCNLIDQQQTTKNCYIYSAFGELLVDSETVPQRYKFTGREWDSESGTQNNRPRQYRPQWGRFLRRDPMGYGAGINLYSYCGNNPVNYTDPFGLDWIMTDFGTKKVEYYAEIRFWYNNEDHTHNADEYQKLADKMSSAVKGEWNRMALQFEFVVREDHGPVSEWDPKQSPRYKKGDRYQIGFVIWDFPVVQGEPKANGAHLVEIRFGNGHKEKDATHTEGEWDIYEPGPKKGVWYQTSDARNAWSHEFGHLLGLQEGYSRARQGRTKMYIPGYKNDKDGSDKDDWSGTIMGELLEDVQNYPTGNATVHGPFLTGGMLFLIFGVDQDLWFIRKKW